MDRLTAGGAYTCGYMKFFRQMILLLFWRWPRNGMEKTIHYFGIKGRKKKLDGVIRDFDCGSIRDFLRLNKTSS